MVKTIRKLGDKTLYCLYINTSHLTLFVNLVVNSFSLVHNKKQLFVYPDYLIALI